MFNKTRKAQMQKEYVDLLEKRVEILESVVFKDVRKNEDI